MYRIPSVVFIFIMAVNYCQSQVNKDSLWHVWNDSSQSDMERAEALHEYAKAYISTDTDSSLFYTAKAYDFSTQMGLEVIRGKSRMLAGKALKQQGKYEEAEKAYKQAIRIARSIGDSTLVADNLQEMGLLYSEQGKYALALTYGNKSLTLRTEEGNNLKMAELLNNTGILHIRMGNYEQATADLERSIRIYQDSEKPLEQSGPMNNLAILKTRQGDYSAAIDLYSRSLTIDEKAGNEAYVAIRYMNLANLYYAQEDNEKFFENAYKSLEIRERLGDKRGILRCVTNIGSVLFDEKRYDEAQQVLTPMLPLAKELNQQSILGFIYLIQGSIQINIENYQLALDNINKAFAIYREIDDQKEIARCHKVLGYYYKEIGDYNRAILEFKQGMELVEEKDLSLTSEIAELLYQSYSATGRSDLALLNYELFIRSRDSINSEKNKREIIRQEYKYTYDKKAIADSLSFASKQQIQEAKLEQTSNQRWALFIVLLIVLAFSVVLYSRIKLIKKQKNTIAGQNIELNHLNENLEQKVEERTKKIVEINNILKASDERYTYALAASNDGIWDYNVPEDSISYSPAIYTMLGYEPYEFPETREGIYQHLHSEDMKVKTRAAHNLFINQNQEDFLLDEYRLKGKDGRTIWVQMKGKVVEKDQNGQPLRIVGTHTDITADKLKGQELLETVLRTEDAERSRISKEIHDGLQQTLMVSFMNLRKVGNELDNVNKMIRDKFDLGLKYLQDSITESRNVAHALMPKEIVDFGILAVFESTIEDVDKTQENTKYHFSHNLKTGRLNNHQIEITLYRILQEAINNITKYAEASNVHIQLKEYDDIYMLTIEDDGKGFDLENIKQYGTGIGFKGMQNRLDAINGHLVIDSEIGKGTAILVEIDRIKR